MSCCAATRVEPEPQKGLFVRDRELCHRCRIRWKRASDTALTFLDRKVGQLLVRDGDSSSTGILPIDTLYIDQ